MGGRNRNLAAEFDILVALDLFDLHLSSGHTDFEVCFPRHLDSDLEVIAVPYMASFDSEFATVRDWRELKEDMGSHVLVVATVTRDVDFLSNPSDDSRPAGRASIRRTALERSGG